MQKQVKAKLMSAVALLLVSAILLSTSTYAWFVLSTAPEVSEMKTTAGANGALAIALQSTDATSGQRVEEITNRVGDSGSDAANTTWGGLVDLTENYGLEKISLSPARLNVDTKTGMVQKGTPLSIPQFGADGRISTLTPMGTVYYDAGRDSFVEGTNYGVNIVGKRDTLNGAGASITRTMDRQWLINTSTAKINTMRAEMQASLGQAVTDNSKGIVNIMKRFFGSPRFEEGDLTTIQSLADAFQGLMADAESALRYALLACCAADTVNYPTDAAGQAALSAVYAKYDKLPLKTEAGADGKAPDSILKLAQKNQESLSNSAALKAAYAAIEAAARSVYEAEKQIKNAQSYLNQAQDTQDNSALVSACTSMFNVTEMYVGLKGEQMYLASTAEARKIFGANKLMELYALKGSGLFHTMATVLGDYTAYIEDITVTDNTYEDENGDEITERVETIYSIDLHATVASTYTGFDPDVNVGCLQSVYETTRPLHVEGTVTYTMEVSTRLNAYGYAVGLAFRSSAGGNLLLQQEAANRMTGETSDSAEGRLPETGNVQGAGSTMSFTMADDMTEAQARALVQKVYVVFLADNGYIQGVAAADADSISVISHRNADTLKDTFEVTATLVMCGYTLDEATGGLIKGTAKAIQDIVSLPADKTVWLTALVYLDGDAVTGGEVSADTTQSLFGSINLQFCSDQKLTGMPYDGVLAG